MFSRCFLVKAPMLRKKKRVLCYSKIRNRIKLGDDEISAWLDAMQILSYFVEPNTAYDILVKDDPDEDRYLIAALESRARFLVSGDKHLLRTGLFEEIRIPTAK